MDPPPDEPLTFPTLSVHAAPAAAIVAGLKVLEVRYWWTNHRGPLLIVTTRKAAPDAPGVPLGHALGVVDLFDVREFTPADEDAAGGVPYRPGCYAWALRNPVTLARPFPVLGQRRIYATRIATRTLLLPWQ